MIREKYTVIKSNIGEEVFDLAVKVLRVVSVMTEFTSQLHS